MHQKIHTFFQICSKHALYTIHGIYWFLLVPWLTGCPINSVLLVSHLVTELVLYFSLPGRLIIDNTRLLKRWPKIVFYKHQIYNKFSKIHMKIRFRSIIKNLYISLYKKQPKIAHFFQFRMNASFYFIFL